jgi:CRISPR-associated Cas5-like protein
MPLASLALCFDAPMQSWGQRSRFVVRDTATEPTKSSLKERGRVKWPVCSLLSRFSAGCGHAGLARGLPWGLACPVSR